MLVLTIDPVYVTEVVALDVLYSTLLVFNSFMNRLWNKITTPDEDKKCEFVDSISVPPFRKVSHLHAQTHNRIEVFLNKTD